MMCVTNFAVKCVFAFGTTYDFRFCLFTAKCQLALFAQARVANVTGGNAGKKFVAGLTIVSLLTEEGIRSCDEGKVTSIIFE